MKDRISLNVEEYTSPSIISASREMSISEIYVLMREKRVRHIPVLEDKKPVGIILDRDLHLLEILEEDDLSVEDIMVKDPYCVQNETPLDHVAFEMSKRKIGSAIVVNNEGEIDGIFTSTDGLNALIEVIRGELD